MNQREKAEAFAALHRGGDPVVLVNAWDAASARIVESAGASAIATTSAGVAWGLGTADGGMLSRDLAVELIRRVSSTVALPVSADIEDGFGATPADVAETIRAVIDAGAVGVNIEDSKHDGSGLRDIAGQSERLAAARAAAGDFPLYINARIDNYLRGDRNFDDTVERASAFMAAGASSIFVPGVGDADTIAQLVSAIAAPLNILAGPGSLSIGELAKLGVARVSLGSSVASAAYGLVKQAAVEALTDGTYSAIALDLPYGELNKLMR